MAEYLSPGVYAESVNNATSPIQSVSASTGGFVGVSVRGVLKKPTLVTSWQNFLDTFAYGMETPFLANSDLAYAVYGFFQNGGTRCYITRVASSTASKATDGEETPVFYAKDEGTWGNKIKVVITENEDNTGNFDLVVKYNDEAVEQFKNVTNDTTKENYFVDVLGKSQFITCLTGTLSVSQKDGKPVATEISLSGGADGIVDLADDDYTKALALFDSVDDVNLICMPGQVSATMTNAILSYAEKRGNVFAIVDGPKSATTADIKTFRKGLSCKNGALYYPWIKVSDPLSKTGKLRECPTCGHVMGVYARTIQERGVWKAPAGVEANIRGAIEVVTPLVKGDCDVLNPLNINVIMPRANYGIVIWGARGLSPDASMRYVSDILLEINVKESVKQGTQWAVFEPNNHVLWTRMTATIEAYLDSVWRDGGFFGETPEQAYFVKCDEELNPENVRNEGKLICELGYAQNKPAEFVIIRIAHSISND